MSKIKDVKGREVLDSRGNPTLEVEISSIDGCKALAIVPSGASTGENEALELRDNEKRYDGKGVLKAIHNIDKIIKPKLIGKSVFELEKIDELLIKLDNTKNKSFLGGNTLIGVSMCIARLGAICSNIPLYKYLSSNKVFLAPRPMLNVINGGAHASFSLDIQEFMIIPIKKEKFSESLRKSVEVYQKLKKILKKDGFNINLGDEGGFAPKFKSNKQALDYIIRAINEAGYNTSDDFKLGLDVAANEFYDSKKKKYYFEKKYIDSNKLIDYYLSLIKKYPLISIEDPFYEGDVYGWKEFSKKAKDKIQIVGDDIFTTNLETLIWGIEENIANAILIKPNQIGTVSETIKTIKKAIKHDYKFIISHRSGESEDTFISHLSLCFKNSQIKTGAPARGERTAKYNEILRLLD